MTWWQRWIVVSVFFGVAWWGIKEFIIYWATREQERMAGKPTAPGIKHRRVS